MRWRALFEDLDAQLDAAERSANEAEIADRVRREQAGIALADRLRAQLGLMLKVGTAGGGRFDGVLTHVGSEWLVLAEPAGEVVVLLEALRSVEGLARNAAQEKSRVARALGLASALRALARDRAAVAVHSRDGGPRIDGVIDRVGKDFLEVAAVLPGEARRPARVSAVYAVPFSAISAISSR